MIFARFETRETLQTQLLYASILTHVLNELGTLLNTISEGMFVLVLLYESRKNGGIFPLTNSLSTNDRLELELREMHTL